MWKRWSLKVKICLGVIVFFALAGLIVLGVILSMENRYRPYITANYHVSPFSEEYIETQSGEIIVEMPEVFELGQIILAVSPLGEAIHGMIVTGTAYHDEVLDHFGPHAAHPAVDMVASLVSSRSPATLGALFAYTFAGETIVPNGEHHTDVLFSPGAEEIALLEDFSRESGFREFYADHTDQYNAWIEAYEHTVAVDSMWQWLEERFPHSYDTIRVVSSPLLGGSHYTHCFRSEDRDFQEITAFVPVIYKGGTHPDLDEEVFQELLLGRFLFTEINHNYVNPTTDRLLNRRRIVNLMEEKSLWHTGAGYDSPTLVFNEYMTWALFTLYTHDTAEEEAFAILREITVETMEDYRGFIRFEAFDEELFDLYTDQKEGGGIDDLYRPLLRRIAS